MKLEKWHIKMIVLNFLSYTFLVYNYSTILVFNSPYISSQIFSKYSVIGAYSAVLISVIMRIPGSYILGPLSDKYGRRQITRISGIGSVIPLVIVPFISHNPILVILLYAIQGFFTGGLTAGINVIGLENLPEEHRGWFSGSAFSVGGAAYLIASLVFFALYSILGNNGYDNIGWKIMFFTSLVMIPLSFSLPESIKIMKSKRVKNPLGLLIKNYRREFIFASLMTGLWASINAVVVLLLPNFLYDKGLTKVEVSQIITLSGVITIISPFLGGLLSERIGRRKVSILGSILNLFSSPIFLFINSFNSALYLVSILSFLALLGSGGIMVYVNELFPTNIRSSGVSISWSIGFTIGTLMSVIVLSIVNIMTGISKFSVVETFTLAILSVLTLLLSVLSKETKGNLERF